MALTLYGLKNCDTCKKALKALEAAGKTVVFRDVRADGVSEDRLRSWLAALGRDKLLNTRSTTWRGLSEDERKIAGDEDVVRLLGEYPALIKRPVIETDMDVHAGWSKAEEALFTKAG